MSGRGFISAEPDGICGSKEELRPYGPNCENICFDCGMKDEKTTEKRMKQHIFGEGFDA